MRSESDDSTERKGVVEVRFAKRIDFWLIRLSCYRKGIKTLEEIILSNSTQLSNCLLISLILHERHC